MHRIFLCDVCGKRIEDERALRFMRDPCALPEEPQLYEVHEDCVRSFLKAHRGKWITFKIPSAEASWFP